MILKHAATLSLLDGRLNWNQVTPRMLQAFSAGVSGKKKNVSFLSQQAYIPTLMINQEAGLA
jgi:hypothetical protein